MPREAARASDTRAPSTARANSFHGTPRLHTLDAAPLPDLPVSLVRSRLLSITFKLLHATGSQRPTASASPPPSAPAQKPHRYCATASASRPAAPDLVPAFLPPLAIFPLLSFRRAQTYVTVLLFALLLAGAPLIASGTPAHAAEPQQPPTAPLRAALAAHVQTLSMEIGPRHMDAPEAYARAASYIADVLNKADIRVQAIPMPQAANCPPILLARFGPGSAPAAASPALLDATPNVSPDTAHDSPPGTPPIAPRNGPALLLCAHYDSVPGSPGAGDNASGVAVLLETAHALARRPPPAAVDIAFFPNEEEPHFMTATSGSAHYAALLASSRALPALAVAVDTVGWPASGPLAAVRIPPALRIAATDLVVGSRPPSRAQASALARSLGCETMATDVGALWLDRSDHAAFAAHGVPAALVAAWTGLFSPLIHSPQDTPQHLDFTLLENVVLGLMDFTRRLGPGAPRPASGAPASAPPPPPAARNGERP